MKSLLGISTSSKYLFKSLVEFSEKKMSPLESSITFCISSLLFCLQPASQPLVGAVALVAETSSEASKHPLSGWVHDSLSCRHPKQESNKLLGLAGCLLS